MKNKKIMLVLLISVMAFGVVGCETTTLNEEKVLANESCDVSFGMEELYDSGIVGSGFVIYRDTVTDVMYLWKWSNSRGGLTEMSDPETGLPLTYTRYCEIYNSKANNSN